MEVEHQPQKLFSQFKQTVDAVANEVFHVVVGILSLLTIHFSFPELHS